MQFFPEEVRDVLRQFLWYCDLLKIEPNAPLRHTCNYLVKSLRTTLQPAGLDRLQQLMQRTGAALSGSTVLNALDGIQSKTVRDLDLFMPMSMQNVELVVGFAHELQEAKLLGRANTRDNWTLERDRRLSAEVKFVFHNLRRQAFNYEFGEEYSRHRRSFQIKLEYLVDPADPSRIVTVDFILVELLKEATIQQWIRGEFDLDVCSNALLFDAATGHPQLSCGFPDAVRDRKATLRPEQYCFTVVPAELPASFWQLEPGQLFHVYSTNRDLWKQINAALKATRYDAQDNREWGYNSCHCDLVLLNRLLKYTRRGYNVSLAPAPRLVRKRKTLSGPPDDQS